MSAEVPDNSMSQRPSPCPMWYAQELHLQERRKMITNIARLLQARKPNAPVEWMQKLPQMARRLEESLFRSANSFDEYKDTQTLKRRLQALAIAMGLRAQQQKPKPEEDGSISQRGASGAQAASNEINSTPAVADYASAAHSTNIDVVSNAERSVPGKVFKL